MSTLVYLSIKNKKTECIMAMVVLNGHVMCTSDDYYDDMLLDNLSEALDVDVKYVNKLQKVQNSEYDHRDLNIDIKSIAREYLAYANTEVSEARTIPPVFYIFDTEFNLDELRLIIPISEIENLEEKQRNFECL